MEQGAAFLVLRNREYEDEFEHEYDWVRLPGGRVELPTKGL